MLVIVHRLLKKNTAIHNSLQCYIYILYIYIYIVYVIHWLIILLRSRFPVDKMALILSS